MQLKELLAQPRHLPTIPALVQSLAESLARDDVSLAEIARTISADPVLSAKLLRLANSAYFRTARGIGSVDDALKLLGVKMVRNLVIGSGLTAACKVAPGLDVRQFWRYSLSTACVARWLASATQRDADLAFMVGLMHGIGQFAMRAGMPKETARIDKAVHPLDAQRADAEREAFGFDYAEAGAGLARLWRFPEAIASGIGAVPMARGDKAEIAAIVHLGAWRARAEAFGEPPKKMAASYPAAVAQSLAIGRDWVPELTDKGEPSARPMRPMPGLSELTAGLDEMLDEK